LIYSLIPDIVNFKRIKKIELRLYWFKTDIKIVNINYCILIMLDRKTKKKITKDLDVKINDVVTVRTLIDVCKDFLGDVNLEFKRDPEMEKDDDNDELLSAGIASDINNNKKSVKQSKIKIESDEDPKTSTNGVKQENEVAKKNDFYGIKIIAVNTTKSLIIVIKLESKKFGIFKVSKPVYDVGINLSQLHKLIRSLDKDDILRISIDSDEKHLLILDVENEVRNSRTRNRLKTLDIDKKTYKIPETKFDMVVTMESSEFHRVCKDLSQLADYVEIVCKENSITFTSTGDCSDKSITIDASEHNGVKIKPLIPGKGLIVQGIFELKYFTMFQKCSGLCQNIQIYLKNNYPIFIKYFIASLGQILVGIVPVNDKSVNNNFSDEDDEYSDDDKPIKIKKSGKNESDDEDIDDYDDDVDDE